MVLQVYLCVHVYYVCVLASHPIDLGYWLFKRINLMFIVSDIIIFLFSYLRFYTLILQNIIMKLLSSIEVIFATFVLIFLGRPGWGISWYINNTLIPELVVERDRTYTFLVYGGNNPADGANYHPFYITDSEIGGRLLNTQEQRTVSPTRFHDMLMLCKCQN